MTDTTLRRRREDIYGVAPGGAEYHAFFASTTGLFAAAFYDKNGVWVEDRGSVVDGSALSLSKKGLTLLIRSDEGGLVGDGTLAFWDKGGPAAPSLNVVDFEAGTSYREEVLSGDAIGFGAGYAAGFLWWIEHTFDFDANPTTVTFRLRRCRCDLSAIETVTEETIDLATGSGNPWHAWVESFSWFAMTQDAALAGFCAHNRASGAAGGTAGEVVARFPLNGDSGALAEHGRPTDLPRTVGVAAATVPAFLVGNPVTYEAGYDGLQRPTFGNLSGYSKADNTSTPPTELWPTSTNWIAAYGGDANATVHSNGVDAAFYSFGSAELEDQLLVRNALGGSFGASPTKRIVPARHPTLDDLWITKPFAMFIRG